MDQFLQDSESCSKLNGSLDINDKTALNLPCSVLAIMIVHDSWNSSKDQA